MSEVPLITSQTTGYQTSLATEKSLTEHSVVKDVQIQFAALDLRVYLYDMRPKFRLLQERLLHVFAFPKY
jgi:hypothetical protein